MQIKTVEFCSLVIRVLLGLLRLQLALDLPLHPPVAAIAAELPLGVQLNLGRSRKGCHVEKCTTCE